MEEQGSLLRQLVMDRRAWVFVAGNAKQMPDQVTLALQAALSKDGDHQNVRAAEDYIKEMMKQNRLQLETWS